ncbi:SH3 domain-containing protein [Leptospira koniambonensis]|uniref:SH3 domain-containing protein n=1 Tax=Leptospira koniambonensis TaxID=2484950 RepID=A0A4R9J3M8_9LEPT|nr:SH3 domain-containing protein [Leptospira koniambonensis]TGL31649.1 SH3 domain-containing protein [Leptospira koniambonensis]
MNYRNIVIIILTIALFAGCKRFFEERGYVVANSGLSLRQSPKIDSNKLSVIPRDEFFIIVDKEGPEETIEGTTERWWKVNYKGEIGWLFSGFAAIYDPSFYDEKKSIYTGNRDIKNEFYNELKTFFLKKTDNHCQLNFISNAFPSGDGDDIFDEVYGIEINTKIDSMAILSKYHSFSVRIVNLERQADQFIISYVNSGKGSSNSVSSIEWELNKEKKTFFNKEKFGKGTNWENLIYKPNNEKSYVCNSHLKSWLYPFL